MKCQASRVIKGWKDCQEEAMCELEVKVLRKDRLDFVAETLELCEDCATEIIFGLVQQVGKEDC